MSSHAESFGGVASLILYNFAVLLRVLGFFYDVKFSVPPDENQPQIMMLHPPCFTVGMVFSGF